VKILYLGDIMGKPGREIVIKHLPSLIRKYRPSLVIAQAENVSHGKSMTPQHMHELQLAGIDFFTGGNHSIERPTLRPKLADPSEPVTAAINQPGTDPAWGSKIVSTSKGPVLVVSLLGVTFPLADEQVGSPLSMIDELLAKQAGQGYAAIVVNFHGDFSSEKRVIGYYLDGRVSAVIGDHWHVPTADAMILPKGTAHITDVGMCGTLHSSLGVSKEIIISRWRDSVKNKNEIAEGPPYQINAVLVDVNTKTGLSKSIKPINLIF
jgi:2',3'-cyclic-nucleotide 2'-phosphodiesterase